MDFPQYRKYSNNKVFFEFHDGNSFTEIKLSGKSLYEVNKFEAKILPDRVFISDLLNDTGNHILIIKQDEFKSILNECSEKRRKLN